MGAHLNSDGEFQSDKYPTCPAGKVPLSVRDPTAQDLLLEYARRRRAVDAEFSDDLETALQAAGCPVDASTRPAASLAGCRSSAPSSPLRPRAQARAAEGSREANSSDGEEDDDADRLAELPRVGGRLTVAALLMASGEFVVSQGVVPLRSEGFFFHLSLCFALFCLGCLLGRPLDR